MVDLARIRAARDAVSRWVSPTPLIRSEHFSRLTGAEVYLKLENLQRTGSFKVRGALNKLLRCRESEGPRPVVAASAGNHAQGVSLAAATLGMSATIVMPETSAIVRLLENKKLLAEGAGAVALAALLSAPPERVRGRAIVVVVSGGNMDLNVLDRVLEQGLIRSGRIFRFAVVLDDVPGALGSLLAVVARQRANVLHIAHDRLSLDLPVGRTRVEAEVETRGDEHIGEVAAALREAGFSIRAHDHPVP